MALIRATLFFSLGKAGWSETYFNSASDLFVARGAMANLVLNRMKCCPQAVSFLGGRVSDDNVQRDSLFVEPGFFGTPLKGTYTEAGLSPLPAEADVGVKLRIEAGTLHRRVLIMRGIPESIVSGEDYQSFNPDWRNALSSMQAVLEGNPVPLGWQLRTQDTTQVAVQVTALAVDTDPRGINVTTAVAPSITVPPPGGGPPVTRALAVGDNVIIKGYSGGRLINGPWHVASVASATQFGLGPRRSVVQTAGLPSALDKCTLGALVYAGQTITETQDESDLGYRKVGRPFGEARGRRKAR